MKETTTESTQREHLENLANRFLQHTWNIGVFESINLAEKGWTFGGFDNAKSRSGSCHFLTKEIKLSAAFLKYTDFYQTKNTLLHEVAHALDFETRGRSGHGKPFRKIAKLIGCDPDLHLNISDLIERSGVEVLKDYKYTGICENCGPLAGFSRRPKRAFQCKKCKTTLTIKQNY